MEREIYKIIRKTVLEIQVSDLVMVGRNKWQPVESISWWIWDKRTQTKTPVLFPDLPNDNLFATILVKGGTIFRNLSPDREADIMIITPEEYEKARFIR